jgi:hypothetical protein
MTDHHAIYPTLVAQSVGDAQEAIILSGYRRTAINQDAETPHLQQRAYSAELLSSQQGRQFNVTRHG